MARGVSDEVDPFDFETATPKTSSGGKPAATGRDQHIGSRIRLRREQLRMSQQALGNALGVTFQQVQKYERGANRVSATRLQDIATALDVKLSYFHDAAGADAGDADGTANGTATGFSETQASFGQAGDLMTRPETIALVASYWRINQASQRKAVLDLVRAMGGD